MEEKYNGWTNRETWAVKLHWDNNEGDYIFFTAEARRQKGEGVSAFEFAEFLKEQAEDIFDTVINGQTPHNEGARLFVADVGSLWRVNWIEIAEAYYEEIDE